MPEPLALAIIAGITTILSNLWNISKGLYELFSSIKNAPKHILALSQDVQGFYTVLGSLRGLLDNLSGDHLHSMLAPILESLQNPLDHCLSTICELQKKINKCTKPSGEAKQSKWSAFRWEFTEKDTNMYRSDLASHKATIDLAVTTATL